jgi:hypothetical protein
LHGQSKHIRECFWDRPLCCCLDFA